MLIRLVVTAGCAMASLTAFATEPVPDYIEAEPDAIVGALGQALTQKIFSGEFTALRLKAIEKSIGEIGNLHCADPLDWTMSDVLPSRLNGYDVVWIERYDVDCDETVNVNLIGGVGKNGTVEFDYLVPGETLAGPLLQIDTRQHVTMASLASGPVDCAAERVFVVDTDVVEPQSAAMQPWRERWTTTACGKRVELDVRFTPTPADGGTDISVSAASP